MEKFVNSLILEKVDEIIETIKESKEYQDYQFLFNKLSQNVEANNLIKEVKIIQKKIVKKESLGESVVDLEEQLSLLVEQLETIPLYVEFVEKQSELNDLYQGIKEKLNVYFDKI